MHPKIVTKEYLLSHPEEFKDLEVIFSTWEMFALSDDELDKLPNLKAIFYGSGSVQGFARPYLKRDILVMSAWGA